MPTFLRKKKEKPKPPEKPKTARDLVYEWEKLKEQITKEQDKFQSQFRDAYEELQRIDALEVHSADLMKECSRKVLEEQESVGPFRYVQGWRQPGYDGEKVLHVLASMKPSRAGYVLADLVSRGLITNLVVNADVARLLHSQSDPSVEEIESAWTSERIPLTPYVKGPK